MTKKQRNIVDELLEGARKFYEELEHILNPEKRGERAPVPVPVPVEPDSRRMQHDPYRRR